MKNPVEETFNEALNDIVELQLSRQDYGGENIWPLIAGNLEGLLKRAFDIMTKDQQEQFVGEVVSLVHYIKSRRAS